MELDVERISCMGITENDDNNNNNATHKANESHKHTHLEQIQGYSCVVSRLVFSPSDDREWNRGLFGDDLCIYVGIPMGKN